MKAAVIAVIAVGAVVVVVGRVRRNNPVAIVGYAVLAVGSVVGLLSR